MLEELAALARMEDNFEQPFVHVACASTGACQTRQVPGLNSERLPQNRQNELLSYLPVPPTQSVFAISDVENLSDFPRLLVDASATFPSSLRS